MSKLTLIHILTHERERRRFIGNDSDADDILQNAFLKLWLLHTYRKYAITPITISVRIKVSSGTDSFFMVLRDV